MKTNKISILNRVVEGMLLPVPLGAKSMVSVLALTIVIAPNFNPGNVYKMPMTLKLLISEQDFTNCADLFSRISGLSDTEGGVYTISLSEVKHEFNASSMCINTADLLQLISKSILYLVNRTVLFTLDNYVNDTVTEIGPEFREMKVVSFLKPTEDATSTYA